MNQIKYPLFITIFFLFSSIPFGSSELDPSSSAPRTPFECLIVDDTSLNRRLIGVMIQSATREVGEIILHYAENEAAALSILAKSPSIQLVVTDGQMTADMGGTKLVAKIRDTFKGFIVAWSGDSTEQAGMMKAGANYGLSKPASPDDVKGMISVWYESLLTSLRPSL